MKVDSIFVIICYVSMIVSNVICSATTWYNKTNNTQISRENPTVITPDGLTFAVWGPIYFLLLGTVIYQIWPQGQIIQDTTRNLLSLAFVLNAGWLPLFAYHLWWLSLLIIILYAYVLYQIYTNMDIHYDAPIPIKDKVWAYAGVSMNLAWVVVATFLNVGIVFRNSNIITTVNGKTTIGGNADWAIACIALVTGIASHQLAEHTDFVYSLTTAWALFGISRMQSGDEATWALCMALFLSVMSVLAILYLTYAHLKKKKKKEPTNELERHLTA